MPSSVKWLLYLLLLYLPGLSFLKGCSLLKCQKNQFHVSLHMQLRFSMSFLSDLVLYSMQHLASILCNIYRIIILFMLYTFEFLLTPRPTSCPLIQCLHMGSDMCIMHHTLCIYISIWYCINIHQKDILSLAMVKLHVWISLNWLIQLKW